MRVAITGAQGMLGQDLTRIFASHHEVLALSRSELDVTVESRVRKRLRELEPDWILHAAAFTRVDEAETRHEQAFATNVHGAQNVALAATECGASILYYSTDYVFSGLATAPYREDDPTDPVNYYGFSKRQGERVVQSLCPTSLIIRTSWLFGAGGNDFVSAIVEAAKDKGRLEVVADQRGKPTWTKDLAGMSHRLVENQETGIYHVTNSGDCSWFEFARAIGGYLDLPCEILPVSTAQYPRPAKRPPYSVLDNYSLRRDGYGELRSWNEALAAFLKKS